MIVLRLFGVILSLHEVVFIQSLCVVLSLLGSFLNFFVVILSLFVVVFTVLRCGFESLSGRFGLVCFYFECLCSG